MLMRDYIKDRIEPIEIENFFDEDFCEQCIKLVEHGIWRESNYGKRKIQTAQIEQSWFEEKLRQYIPLHILDWEYFGIHKETCQFFKYSENDTFPDHQDQAINWSPDVQSLLTLVVYLNRCQGGATGFPERKQSITPATGKAVIFPQNLLHNSGRIESGLKYILRAQILYKNPGTFPYERAEVCD
jgi:predicted 2-oxoglutarate/Fe(II)-dependent dioxygenase YbiX